MDGGLRGTSMTVVHFIIELSAIVDMTLIYP